MADKKKSHKLFKKLGLVLLAMIVICGVLVGVDYINYKDGNRSHLFGTLDNYKQNQTLKFGDLDLKVTSVSLKPYSNPTAPSVTNCDALSNSDPNPLIGVSGAVINDPYFSPRGICQSHLSEYNDALSYIKSNKSLVVTFNYNNVSNRTLNLSHYKAKIIINTPAAVSPNSTIDGLRPSCSGLPDSQLLNGSIQQACLAEDISNKYHEPLVLSVTSQGKEKDISISLP
jgi:hypothetical protein